MVQETEEFTLAFVYSLPVTATKEVLITPRFLSVFEKI